MCDTLIQFSGYTLLVSSYFDRRLERNPNLERDFRLIPWHGEIAILFVGKRGHYVSQGPPGYVIHIAIVQYVLPDTLNTGPSHPLCRYMKVCMDHEERGAAFPSYMYIKFVSFLPIERWFNV